MSKSVVFTFHEKEVVGFDGRKVFATFESEEDAELVYDILFAYTDMEMEDA